MKNKKNPPESIPDLKVKVKLYTDGFTARFHNKRIQFSENEKHEYKIQFWMVDTKANEPAVWHGSLKGKVRLSSIKMTSIAFQVLIDCYLKYLTLKLQNPYKK